MNIGRRLTRGVNSNSLAETNGQFQSMWEAFFWLVLRGPHQGTPVPATIPYFIVKTRDFLETGMPVLFVVYCIPAPMIVEVVEIRILP